MSQPQRQWKHKAKAVSQPPMQWKHRQTGIVAAVKAVQTQGKGSVAALSRRWFVATLTQARSGVPGGRALATSGAESIGMKSASP